MPEPDAIRVRQRALLETARAADALPWPPARAQEHLFHNMANWLPAEERDQLRHEFKAELERLRRDAPA